jgi:hypothetical protein
VAKIGLLLSPAQQQFAGESSSGQARADHLQEGVISYGLATI